MAKLSLAVVSNSIFISKKLLECWKGSTPRARALSLFSTLILVMSTSAALYIPQRSYAATSNELNFQGRLLDDSGSTIADGTYNIEFNLYYVSTGGTAQWTEDRLVTNGEGVSVQNGYFSVYLGELDAFPVLDWSEDLYLGMTVRGTTNCAWGSCTPTDSEMTPRFKLTAVPYAFRAANVASSDTNAATTNTDAVSIITGDALGASSNSGNINIDTGTATGTTGAITIGTSNASAVTIGSSGVLTTVNGNVTLGASNADTLTINAGESGATGGDIIFADSSFQSCTALETDAAGILTCGVDDSGAGSGAFSSAGGLTQLTTGTDSVTIGSGTAGGKLFVDGDTDEIQLQIQANSVQTADLAVFENSGGLDFLTISRLGDVTLSQSLILTGSGTLPGAPTEGEIYYDSTNNQLLIYEGSQWEQLNGSNSATIVVAASNSLNPELADYRADGTADEVTIETALAALPSSGGTVYLMEGTYNIDADIDLAQYDRLVGAGDGTILLLTASRVSAVNVIDLDDDNYVANLKVDGNKTNQTDSVELNGIRGLVGRDNNTIENVTIINVEDYGIRLTGGFNNINAANIQDTDGPAVEFFGSANNSLISNSYVEADGNSASAGVVANGDRISITNNNVIGYNNSITTSGLGNTVIGNTVSESEQWGIYLSGQDSTISGNTVSNNVADSGIYIGSAATRNTVSANTVNGAGGSAGILIAGADSNLITGNSIYNSVGDGIGFNGDSDDNIITNNVISDTAGATFAIDIGVDSDNTYLSGNIYSGTGAASINDSGTGTIYANQTTAGNTLQSGSSVLQAYASSTLTGTADPDGTVTLTGTSTLFTEELVVGDRITINAETRIVTAIASDTSLTVNNAFSDTASASITRLPLALSVRGSSGTQSLTVNDTGQVIIGDFVDGNPSTNLELIVSSSGSDANIALLSDDSASSILYFGSESNPTGEGRIGYDISSNVFTFATNGVAYASIESGGIFRAGTATEQGSLLIGDGDGEFGTLQVASLDSDETYILPDSDGSDTVCLLDLGNCAGAATTLQQSYEAGNTILATNAEGDIDFTVSEATNFSVDITGTGSFLIQDSGTNVFTIADGGAVTLTETTDTTSAFLIERSGGEDQILVDNVNDRVTIGNSSGDVLTVSSGSNPCVGINMIGCAGGNTDNAQFAIQQDWTGASAQTIRLAGTGLSSAAGLQVRDNDNDIVFAAGSNTGSVVIRGVTSQVQDLLVVQNDTPTDLFTIDQAGAVLSQNDTNSTTAFQVLDADGGNPVFNVDTTNERVGVGTASPGTAFEVVGDATIDNNADSSTFLYVSSGSTTAQTSAISLQDRGTNEWRLQKSSGNNFQIYEVDTTQNRLQFITSGSSQFRLGADTVASFQFQNVSGDDLLTINSDGDLIFEGATADAFELTVVPADVTADRTVTIPQSSAASDTFCLLTLANCAGSSGAFTSSAGLTQLSTSTDNVTIGSSTAGGKLFVEGDADEITLQVQSTASQTADVLLVEDNSNNDLFRVSWYGAATFTTRVDSTAGFVINDADGGTSVFNIDTTNERVGISDDSPDAKLDVEGSSTNTTADTFDGFNLTVTDTGIVTSGTDTTVGAEIDVTRTGATGGTINTTGLDIQVTGDNAGGGTSTVIGLAIDVGGADNNYALEVDGGSGRLTTIDSQGALVVGGDTRATGSTMFTVQGTFNDAEAAIVANGSSDDATLSFGYTGNVSNQAAVHYDGSDNSIQFQANGGTGILNLSTNSTVSIGTSSVDGEIALSDGSSNFGTIEVASLDSDETYIFPDSDGSDTVCLLDLGNCAGAGATLQSAYNNGATILTTDNRDIGITLANTTTDSNFLIDIATGSSSRFAIQNNGTDVVRYDTSSGFYVQGTGSNTTVIGNGATSSVANSTVYGYNASATGTLGVVIGNNASTSQTESIVIGANAVIDGGTGGATVIGEAAQANTNNTTVIGSNASGDGGQQSVVIGATATSGQQNQVVIGFGATAGGGFEAGQIAIGENSTSTDADAIAIGRDSITDGRYSIALGTFADAQFTESIAIGTDATTTASNQFVLGAASYGITSLYLGEGVTSASAATADITLQATGGSGTDIAGADFTIAGGQGTGTGVGGSIILQTASAGSTGTSLNALTTYYTLNSTGLLAGSNGATISVPGTGSNSEQFGLGASATSLNALAIGSSAVATDQDAIAIGRSAAADEARSILIGTDTTVSGTDGIVIGDEAQAGGSSIAIGSDAVSSSASVAVGDSADATTAGAIAIGDDAQATNTQAVALGQNAIASNQNSIAIGAGADSTRQQSIAIGTDAQALFDSSIALGRNATTTVANQFVLGAASYGITNLYLGEGVTSASAATADITLQATGGSGTDIAGADFTIAGGQGTGTGLGGAILLQTATAGSTGASLNSLTTRLEVQQDGDVAIDTDTLFVDAVNNRVGIGTATPDYEFEVEGTFTSTSGDEYLSGFTLNVNPGSASSGNYYATGAELIVNGGANTLSGIASAFENLSTYTGTGTLAYLGATDNYVYNESSGTITLATGQYNYIENESTGTITEAAGSYSWINNTGTGTITDAYGYFVNSAVNSGGGTFTNNYGVYVQDQTVGSSDYGVYIQGADTYALWVDADTSRFDGLVDARGNVDLGDATSDTISATGRFDTDLIPSTDDARDLGSSTLRWRDLYLGPASLHIGTNGDEGILSYDTTNDSFEFDQSLQVVASGYINFGATNGSTGYGIRDNAGTIQLKNSGGSWENVCLDDGTCTAVGTAGGDLTGTYPNPTIATGAVDNDELAFDTGQNLTTTSSPQFAGLGVGTGTLDAEFQVETNNSGAPTELRISNAASSGDSQLVFEENSQDLNIFIRYDGGENDLRFGSQYDGAPDDLLVIERNGSGVGIGTSAPNHQLDVQGNIGIIAGGNLNFGTTTGDSGYGIRDNGGVIEIKNSGGSWASPSLSGSGAANRVTFWNGASSLSSDADLTFDGTTLGVNSSAGNITHLSLSDGTDTLTVSETSGDFSIINTQQNNGIVIYDGTAGVEIQYNGTTNVEVDANGLTAVSNLYLGSTSGGRFYSDTSGRIRTPDDFYVDANSANTYLYSTNTYLGASSGDVTQLRGNIFTWTNGRIHSNGYIHIGSNSAPNSALQVQDDNVHIGAGGSNNLATASGDLYVQDDIEVDDNLYTSSGAAGSPSLAFSLDTNTGFYSYSGDVIGVTNGGTTRYRFGTLAIAPNVSGAQDLGAASLRWNTIYSNNALNTSDERLKDNINYNSLGLDFINDLAPASWNWNGQFGAPNDGLQYNGLIAQNVASALSTAGFSDPTTFAGLKQDSESGYYFVDYTKFIGPIIQAVKDIDLKVVDLENRVSNLEVALSDPVVNSLVVNGNTEVQDLYVNGKIVSQGDAPVIANGAVLGASDTAVVEGNDTAGTVTVTIQPGSTLSIGEIASVVFDEAYAQAPRVSLTPKDADSASIRTFIETTTTGFVIQTIDIISTPGAPAGPVEYTFDYIIIQ